VALKIIQNDVKRRGMEKTVNYHKKFFENEEGNIVTSAININEKDSSIEIKEGIEIECENNIKDVSLIIISKIKEIINELDNNKQNFAQNTVGNKGVNYAL
jgi:hypothetical protein